MKNYLRLLFLLLIIPFFGKGQEIITNTIPLLNKLPVNAVHRIYQDSEGYMWYGTVDGLCRDDGYDIQVFRADIDHPDLLQNNLVEAIAEDGNHNIWFGTDKGLYILDKQTYEVRLVKEPRLHEPLIHAIHATSDGTIWVSISGLLLHFAPDETLLDSYPLQTDGNNHTIHNLIEDRQGNLLISVWRKGIYRLNRESNQFEPFTDPSLPMQITAIIQDKDHPYYWLGTWDQGIFCFDPSDPEQPYTSYPTPLNRLGEPDGVVFFIVQDDSFGYLWTTGLSDLHVYEVTQKKELRRIDTSPFLRQGNKMLNEVIKTRDGSLWVSGYDFESFIISFRNHRIDSYPLPDLRDRIQGNPAIVQLCKDDEGVYWISHERIGLSVYSAETDQLRMYTDFAPLRNRALDHISNIIKSNRNGYVWVSDYGSLVYLMRQRNLQIEIEKSIQLGEVTHDCGAIECLYEGSDRHLWIGTSTALFLHQITKEETKLITHITGKVTGITQTADGIIWVCTESNGLFRIENEQITPIPAEVSFRCIDASYDGKIWLGTEQGNVMQYDPATDSLTDYSSRCGMNGDVVSRIMVDRFNHVWIVNNQKLTEFSPRNGAYRIYPASDVTLLLDRFLPRATLQDAEGRLYFGGIPGFISVEPSYQLESLPKPVHVQLTNINVAGKSRLLHSDIPNNAGRELVLAPDDRNIELFFSSLNHRHANRIRYAYMLKGVDKEWVELPAGRNSAFYNQLAKGSYLFQVNTTDENGLWGTEVTEFTLQRRPAFYETWWAYLLYTLTVGLILWGLLSLYLQRLNARHEKELTEQVTQMKLRYFTNISHELLTPLSILTLVADEMRSTDEEQAGMLLLLKTNVLRLKRLLQQILDFRKVESGGMVLNLSYGDLTAFLHDICYNGFAPLIKKKQIRFSLRLPDEKVYGYYDMDKLDKILYNLLSNAFKYTDNGKAVWLSLELSQAADESPIAIIRVGDEGIGIKPKEQNRIFTRFYTGRTAEPGKSNGIGLSLVKDFIELHHGTISLESQPGKGSVFTIEIPIGKGSYRPEEFVENRVPVGEERETQQLLPTPPSTDESLATDTTLLLVEDNEELLALMQRILGVNYRVVTAHNGREALERIQEQSIDLVVSDIMMPEMDGIALCRTLKNDLKSSHILVLLLTAKTHTEDKVEAYNAGADGYISKPFEVALLAARIENLLRNRRQKQLTFRRETDLQINALDIPSVDEQLLKRAVEVVEANLTEPDFDVAKLSEQLNMSRSTFTRKIKSVTGLTPLEFIRNIKMKQASRLLKSSGMGISEIALMLGYFDRKYFTTCFKEEFGVTPSEYQKQQNEG